MRLKKIPCIKSSDMYNFLLPESKPTVQEKYNFNWEKIWPRITFKYIKSNEREVIFKFLHGILPTKSRVYQMKQSNSPLCPLCNVIEDNSHMFLKCRKVQGILEYFKIVLRNTCNLDNVSIEKILYLDIKLKTKKQMNTVIVMSVHYISTVWYNRCRNFQIDPILLKANIINHQRLLSLILKDRMKLQFTEMYCNINTWL